MSSEAFRRFRQPCTSIAALLFAAVPALAHHGVAHYDMRVIATLEGVVERWSWQSPHTSLTLAVERGSETQIWEIEGAPPGWMAGQGWTPESFATGETVTITYHPLRQQPARAGILMAVARADGEVLKVNRPARLGGP